MDKTYTWCLSNVCRVHSYWKTTMHWFYAYKVPWFIFDKVGLDQKGWLTSSIDTSWSLWEAVYFIFFIITTKRRSLSTCICAGSCTSSMAWLKPAEK